ncbi:hypothetical protein [Paenibacillus sp. MBLB4367]|uniref:hypothetical protein n=1 Tax=Paenibacillus sp. MBLB4367 TaxID=3384767 RepID=UPI0039080DDC
MVDLGWWIWVGDLGLVALGWWLWVGGFGLVGFGLVAWGWWLYVGWLLMKCFMMAVVMAVLTGCSMNPVYADLNKKPFLNHFHRDTLTGISSQQNNGFGGRYVQSVFP